MARVSALLSLVLLCAAVLATVPVTALAAPGDEMWRQAYDGGAGGEDEAADLAFAPKGYFYVVGWVTRTVGGKPDIAVIRYSKSGARRWIRRYGGPAHEKDVAQDSVCDAAGNLYVTGYIVRGAYNVDLIVIKYSPRGKRLWVRTWDSAKHGDDNGRRIALDGAGNVYVAGSSQTDPSDLTGYDLKLLKFDRYGHRKWVRSHDPGVGMYCDTTGLVIDKKRGRVYVGAAVETAGADWQWLLARYSTSGRRRWLRLLGDPTNDQAKDLALAPDGGVLQVGSVNGGGPTGSDAAIAKWTPAGVVAPGWLDVYDGVGSGNDHFYGVAVDRFGTVRAVGDDHSNLTGDNALIRWYDESGGLKWSRTYYHDGAQTLWKVAVDSAGNTYAGGYSNESGANPAYLLTKYLADGTWSWRSTAKESTTVTSGTDTVQAIGYRGGAYKGLYVTGNGDGDTTVWDLFTIRFEP